MSQTSKTSKVEEVPDDTPVGVVPEQIKSAPSTVSKSASKNTSKNVQSRNGVVLYIHNPLINQFNGVMNVLNNKVDQYIICFSVPEGVEYGDNVLVAEGFDPTSLEKNGNAVLTKLVELYKRNIIPNVIVTHIGCGLSQHIRAMFPNAAIVGFVEWYFKVENTTHLIKNRMIRDRVEESSVCLCPTRAQKAQFPLDIRRRIMVMHEGLDTDFFNPNKKNWGGALEKDNETLITYVSRGLEPCRGILEFVNAVKLLLDERKVKVIIVGRDETVYGNNPDNISYLEESKKILGDYVDTQVKFVGNVNKEEVGRLFQHSNLHVHFNNAYVTSWSMIEAMNMGCLMLGSNTFACQEFIRDGFNGHIVDFKDAEKTKDVMLKMLDMSPTVQEFMRENAMKVGLGHTKKEVCTQRWADVIQSLII